MTDGEVQAGCWGGLSAGAPGPGTAPTNDLRRVLQVLKTAIEPGYVLVGPNQAVYRRDVGSEDAEAVPAVEAAAVHQLLGSVHLRRGASRTVRIGRYRGAAETVLVTRVGREALARWARRDG
jgi:hypothetical protein